MNYRCSDQKVGCYGCGSPDHFVTHCPKKNKYDTSMQKDKWEYTSGKPKSKEGFDKEALRKKYLKKAKAQQRTFLASLSDLDNNSDDNHSSSLSSYNESELKHEDKPTRLCFVTGSTHKGFYTMAIDDEVKASKDEVLVNDDTSEVTASINDLAAELETMNNTLFSADKLLKCAALERKEYKHKLEIALKELEEAMKHIVIVFDEVEFNECASHMSSLASLI
jgi:uncharacterized protein YnzC (UPF0291/DUF896 family)